MRHGRTSSEAHDRVLAVLQENAASLLKLARRHSLCDDDAHDAYQRALEIYLRKVEEVDEGSAGPWLRTVVKHEAMAVRAMRQRLVGGEEVDLDALEAPEISPSDDRVISFDRITRAAEALQHCKRDEVAAMVLKADGHSYKEIAAATGFSATKVNRCLAEGRARFLRRYASIETGEECDRVAPFLSMIVDGEATPKQLSDVRPHLRNCSGCRNALREMTDSQEAIHIVLPGVLILGVSGFPDGSAGFLARMYELFVGGLHDRAAITVMKAQSAMETVSATKVAAVAASAAAVAGGGAIAVDRARTEPEGSRVATSRPEPALGSARPVADRFANPTPEPRATARIGALGRVGSPARAPQPRNPRRSKPKRPPRQEFAFEGAGAPVPSPDRTPSTTTSTSTTKSSSAQPTATSEPSAETQAESFGFERTETSNP